MIDTSQISKPYIDKFMNKYLRGQPQDIPGSRGGLGRSADEQFFISRLSGSKILFHSFCHVINTLGLGANIFFKIFQSLMS